MTPVTILLLIIFLEGYAVLSTELLALRLLVPFTGSGTDTTAVVIAAVLMPLAFGYYAGGRFRTRKNGVHASTVRKRLLRNLALAAAILTPGLSWIVLDTLFDRITPHIPFIQHRVLLTALYAGVFLVYPVFLLGQTVPLVSTYFPRGRLPALTGKILFFSTLGSFSGAIFCTLVLMAFAGVHAAAAATIGCLALLSTLLAKRRPGKETLAAFAALLLALGLNNGAVLSKYGIVENNTHHTIRMTTFGTVRTMQINGNLSASLDARTDRSAFECILYIERNFIDPIAAAWMPVKDVLVIGAGGFTVGKADRKNRYTYLDIDPALRETAEKHMLQEPLGPNKTYIPVEARAWLREHRGKKFDLIVLDAYQGRSFSPEELVTHEFFAQIRSALKPGGYFASNMVASPALTDPYALRLDNTIRSVFPNANRQVLGDYDAWNPNLSWMNVIYSARNDPDAPQDIYTDDRNRAAFDKPGKLY